MVVHHAQESGEAGQQGVTAHGSASCTGGWGGGGGSTHTVHHAQGMKSGEKVAEPGV